MNKNLRIIPHGWWVVQSKPNAEEKAIRQLSNQGFVTYCPMYQKETLRARQIKTKTIPLFPCYVFIEADEHAKDTIHTIRSTYGVSRLLKIGEMPILVPGQVICDIKLIEAQQIGKTESYFKKGELVKIKEGLYRGLEAVYQMDDGLKRVVILLNILNKETPLHINKDQLHKI